MKKFSKSEIEKYIQGYSDQEPSKEMEDFLNSPEGEKLLTTIAEEHWENSSPSSSPLGEKVDSERLFLAIHDKVASPGHGSGNHIGKWLKIAAVLVLGVGLSYLIIALNNTQNDPSVAHVAHEVVKTTSKGQKSTILLSDGSTVVLNSGSKLSYSKYFSDSSRNLTLEGEAFFEVAKDKDRPFSVVANGTVTTALGTSFNINTRNGSKISLASGKVVVTGDFPKKYFLSPGEALMVADDEKITTLTFDLKKDLSWKEGIIYFENTPFSEAVEILENWYDVQFETDQQLLEKTYTGQFDNASLERVLESMGFALNFEFLMNGRKVKILSKN